MVYRRTRRNLPRGFYLWTEPRSGLTTRRSTAAGPAARHCRTSDPAHRHSATAALPAAQSPPRASPCAASGENPADEAAEDQSDALSDHFALQSLGDMNCSPTNSLTLYYQSCCPRRDVPNSQPANAVLWLFGE